MTDTTTTPSPPGPDSVSTGRSGWRTVVTLLLIVVVAAIVAMWVYAFFFASGRSADLLRDTTFAPRSQAICAAYKVKIDALPPARSAKTPQDRAVVLDQANELVAAQVAELGAVRPSDPDDLRLVNHWLSDWESYVRNRGAYADQLRSGKDGPFAVDDVGGQPITLRMDAFANTNSMSTCQVPLDV